MATGAYLLSVSDVGRLTYAILPMAAALLAIYLYWKNRPNSGAFALIALYMCGEMFTGTPFDIVYSAFYVNAIWTAFGCFVLGVAVIRSGLVERLVHRSTGLVTSSYARLIIGLMISGIILSFLVPTAIARIFLIVPIVIALADKLGFRSGGRGRTGLRFAAIVGTVVPSYAILPATVPGIVLLGSAEQLFSLHLSYGDYFVANFPVLILPATLVATLLLVYLFREQPSGRQTSASVPPARLSSHEIGTLIIALAAVGLWMTDQYHGLPMAWIAIGAATLCLLPGFGPLRDVSVLPFVRARTWLLLFGVIGALTIAKLTGLGESASETVVNLLDLSRAADGSNYAVLIVLAMVLSVFFTVQAAPAVFALLATDAGLMTGWPLEGILMTQVAAWVFLLLPHAIPGLWIGLRSCGVQFRQVMSFVMLYFVIGVLAILPLHFQWLRFLNYIP